MTVWEKQGWHIKRWFFCTLWSFQMCGWSCLKDLLTWGGWSTSLALRNVLSIFNTIRSASCCSRKKQTGKKFLRFYVKFSSHAKSVLINQKNIINSSMSFILHLWIGHIICILLHFYQIFPSVILVHRSNSTTNNFYSIWTFSQVILSAKP